MTQEQMLKSLEARGKEASESSSQAVLMAATAYLDIKAQIKALEDQLKTHKEILEARAKKAADGVVLVGGVKIELVNASREFFNKENAREGLTEQQYNQYVAPFFKKTNYSQLKVRALEE